MKINSNKIISIIILLFVGFMTWQTTLLRKTPIQAEPGPKLFPAIILAAMGILAIFLWFVNDAERIKLAIQHTNLKDILVLILIIGAGTFAIYAAGFFAGVFIALFGIMLYGCPRRWLSSLIFSTITVGVLYFLFNNVMRITLPKIGMF